MNLLFLLRGLENVMKLKYKQTTSTVSKLRSGTINKATNLTFSELNEDDYVQKIIQLIERWNHSKAQHAEKEYIVYSLELSCLFSSLSPLIPSLLRDVTILMIASNWKLYHQLFILFQSMSKNTVLVPLLTQTNYVVRLDTLEPILDIQQNFVIISNVFLDPVRHSVMDLLGLIKHQTSNLLDSKLSKNSKDDDIVVLVDIAQKIDSYINVITDNLSKTTNSQLSKMETFLFKSRQKCVLFVEGIKELMNKKLIDMNESNIISRGNANTIAMELMNIEPSLPISESCCIFLRIDDSFPNCFQALISVCELSSFKFVL